MDMLKITGGRPLQGHVTIDGAKNSALPIMASSLAVSGTTVLKKVPDLVDVSTMTLLLRELAVSVVRNSEGGLEISSDQTTAFNADWELMRRMRAGICVLGPLLARFGKAVVSLPGGCNIGHRPVDLHLKGLAALGADVRIERGFIVAECDRLRAADIDLTGPAGSTVTGTCNVMVAAALAKGRTTVRGAACEPEVVDLGNYLNACGASISGLGTATLTISGVESLQGCTYQIIPDRIEAATFAIAAAATRSQITIRGCRAAHMVAVLQILRSMGVAIRTTTTDDSVERRTDERGTVERRANQHSNDQHSNDELHVDGRGRLRVADVTATPYPGVPTDTQAQLMALQTTIDGSSRIRDMVFPDRFLHASELMRMGASIVHDGQGMMVHGGKRLSGAHVMASDLRASAALVIAALAADGESVIHRIYHLDRGYCRLEDKLSGLDASVIRVRES